jgi:hypothetical protein
MMLGSYGAPAFILSLAARFCSLLSHSRGLSFASFEVLRWNVCGAPMTTPVGRAHLYGKYSYNFLRARRTGFSHRVGAPTTLTVWGSGPSLYPSSPECVEGVFSEVTLVHL